MARESWLHSTADYDFGSDKPKNASRLAFLSSVPRRAKLIGLSIFAVINVLLLGALLHSGLPTLKSIGKPSFLFGGSSEPALSTPRNTKLHVVLPANNKEVNLCKLLLGSSLLGYPTPTLLGWEETFDQDGILGGGSHLAKVSRVLEYLQSLDASQDDELVLMLDAYDIQLQLPASVLIDRYYETREATQKRAIDFAGAAAVTGEGIQQLVMFGAGKRCAPNQPHTIACYPLPESPLPMDLYGPNTDTVVGHNHYYSVRQRYLNSGYILGPAKDMRRVFAEAWRIIEDHPERDPLDDGSHGSDSMYHGSDQSIFATMFGRQEWCREKLRLKHAPRGTKPRSSQIFFSPIDNVLNPSFTHEVVDFDLSEGNPHEYGIFLDYFSDFGHQTINSEEDAKWLRYAADAPPFDEQVGPRMPGFDCPVHAPEQPPADILRSVIPNDANTTADVAELEALWFDRALYTHLCSGRIPVLRHMNGDKGHREFHWPLIWYQPRAREMLARLGDVLAQRPPPVENTWEQHKADPRLAAAGGVWTDKGALLQWGDVCLPEWDGEIFRDV
ncbi:hypothetical protein F4780DRAFT_777791 [Xylariomycetidae sp. FL0641]|nr:hypothetical protein F4780DRAFT_777791 [Xylariomycetidae sp. FL0641]